MGLECNAVILVCAGMTDKNVFQVFKVGSRCKLYEINLKKPESIVKRYWNSRTVFFIPMHLQNPRTSFV